MRTLSHGLSALAIVALLTATVGLRPKASEQDPNRVLSVKGVIAEIGEPTTKARRHGGLKRASMIGDG